MRRRRPKTWTRLRKRCAAALGRAICRQYQNEKGELTVINVAPSLEERLLSSVVWTDQGAVLALDPQQAQTIASRIAKALEQALAQPVLLCSATLRPHLWRLFARVLPHLGVLSHNVPDDLQRATRAALTDWVLGETIGGACA
jgi:flagellar biosynthesis protein FlhA